MTDATKQLIGKAARRIAVAAAGAMGLTAAQVDGAVGQIVIAVLAFLMLLIAEWFSSRHDLTMVERAVAHAIDDPDDAEDKLIRDPKALNPSPPSRRSVP